MPTRPARLIGCRIAVQLRGVMWKGNDLGGEYKNGGAQGGGEGTAVLSNTGNREEEFPVIQTRRFGRYRVR